MSDVPNGKKIILSFANSSKRSFYTEMNSQEDVATFFQNIATNKILFIRYIDNSVEAIYLRDVVSIRVFDAEYDASVSLRMPYPSAMLVEELAMSGQANSNISSNAKIISDPNIGGIVVSGL